MESLLPVTCSVLSRLIISAFLGPVRSALKIHEEVPLPIQVHLDFDQPSDADTLSCIP
jgi:hypothetical protein